MVEGSGEAGTLERAVGCREPENRILDISAETRVALSTLNTATRIERDFSGRIELQSAHETLISHVGGVGDIDVPKRGSDPDIEGRGDLNHEPIVGRPIA
jgi:hypothetical protein